MMSEEEKELIEMSSMNKHGFEMHRINKLINSIPKEALERMLNAPPQKWPESVYKDGK